MLVDRKPFIYVWGPFYRFVHDRLVVHYLERLKAFFFAESNAHLQQISVQLSHVSALTSQIERQVAAFESNERARWASFEQLYLCWLRDPDRTNRYQMEQLLYAEKRNGALRAELSGRLAAFEERNQCLLDRLDSMNIQNLSLLETLTALDRNHRTLITGLDALEAETRFRWQAMEHLITAFLSDPDRSILARVEQAKGVPEHHKSAAGAVPRA